jgi:SPP1 family predicted phage head-tail adaptor
MRAGRLRHRVYLQQQVATQDGLGGAIITWVTVKEVWAGIEALFGTEAFTADQVQSSTQVRIIIRYASEWKSIDTTWRVQAVQSGKKYDITSAIQPDQRSRPNTVIELFCKQGETDDE